MSGSVTVVGKVNMRPAQKSLYELICRKLHSGDAITISEAKDIWLRQVHSNWKWSDGKPTHYVSVPRYKEDGKFDYWTTELQPFKHEEMLKTVLLWLTHNIGMMVIKGHLKVIPQIEINDIRELPPTDTTLPKQSLKEDNHGND
jgi:hypothetical protein